MKQLIPRKRLYEHAILCLKESPVSALLGARQTGKTTLAHMIAENHREVHFFDLCFLTFEAYSGV